MKKDPAFLQLKYVCDTCKECGMMNFCEKWSECMNEIGIMEYNGLKLQCRVQQTINKYTQLELGHRRYLIKHAIQIFANQLQQCRLHLANLKWKRWMLKRNTIMFQLDLLHIFQINFEVRLNMFATKKDNLSVDNHAVIDN
jgi:hypothetical protein